MIMMAGCWLELILTKVISSLQKLYFKNAITLHVFFTKMCLNLIELNDRNNEESWTYLLLTVY